MGLCLLNCVNLFLCYTFFAEDPVVSSPDVGDLSPEGPLPPLILLQQLLSAATQPSPIKAIFDRREMEVSRKAFFSKTVLKQC